MTIENAFSTFCEAITLKNFETMKTTVGEITRKLNKKYYDLNGDKSSHGYIVGSVGRNTAVKNASDLDMIFDLPEDVYKRFNAYESNGQSALLQEVKNVLKEHYPRTELRADGQVVVIEFTGYTVELVPGFKQSDNRFRYPDTNNGGSWKYTDPLSEQKECSACEKRSNQNYYNFCHIVRCLRNKAGFSMGGLLIDTLVYNHFEANDDYSLSDYEDYLDVLKELLYYLKGLDKKQKYWSAVGSNQQVNNTDNGSWINEFAEAYGAIKDLDEQSGDLFKVLHDLLGKDFPTATTAAAFSSGRVDAATSGEQFIETMLPVDMRYSLRIDCKVTQDGWRPTLLREMLRRKQWLSHQKKLEFYIENTNCPKPYSIYWKVRNVGSEAIRRGMIRGEIKRTDLPYQIEHTNFYGPHFVECFLVKNNVCVAHDRIDVPIDWH